MSSKNNEPIKARVGIFNDLRPKAHRDPGQSRSGSKIKYFFEGKHSIPLSKKFSELNHGRRTVRPALAELVRA